MKILSTIVLLLTAVTLSAQPDAATCTGQTCTDRAPPSDSPPSRSFPKRTLRRSMEPWPIASGRFSVRIPHGNLPHGDFTARLRKKQQDVTITQNTDLGRIVLNPSEISLQGVEVRADPIVREADRFVVNVADMPQAIGRTAVEMLKLSPGVWIERRHRHLRQKALK